MFYAIIFLIIFSVILLIADYQNKYSWLFVMMVVGMVISFFSIVMHISVMGNYYEYGGLFRTDYQIYTYITRRFKIPLSYSARLMNGGIALYLLSVPLFAYEFGKNIINDTIFYTRNTAKLIILFLLPVFYVCFYDPSIALNFYILYHGNNPQINSEMVMRVISIIHVFNKIWVSIYLFYPILILYRYCSENTIMFIKKQILSLALCLLVMNTMFYWLFFTSPFMFSTHKIFTSGFWIFENIQSISSHYYMAIPLVTLVVLQFTIVVLLNFRMGSMIHIFTDRKIHKNINRMNELLSDTFHSQKNILFSINLLAKQANDSIKNKDNFEETEKLVNKILDITSSSLYKTSEMLDSLREIRYRFKKNSISEALNEAISKTNIPSNVKIHWLKNENDKELDVCRFDFYHMSKVFINILNNAVEAIEMADRSEGWIEIDVAMQFQWIVIAIKDNGTGIKKADRKKLFSAYYSGNKGIYNWGLGLSYVYKVVKAHLGLIRIESKYGEYTSIYIMLPGGRYGKHKI